MNKHYHLHINWTHPINPIYSSNCEQIAHPLITADGIVTLDGADLIKVNLDGEVLWRCSDDYGFWGSPTQRRGTGSIICANGENKLRFIDNLSGQIIKSITFPSSACTDILVGPNGDLWLGIGAAECLITRINAYDEIVYMKPVARDMGLAFPLSLTQDNLIWIATTQGLVQIDALSGHIESILDAEHGIQSCLSRPLLFADDILVASMLTDGGCGILRISDHCQIMNEFQIPHMLRAELLAVPPEQRIWLVGSTVSSLDEVVGTDQTIVTYIDLNRDRAVIDKLAPQRSIDISLDPMNNLWIGTYTYHDDEDRESGELMTYRNGFVETCWTPSPASGVGAPYFLSEDTGVILTSNSVNMFMIKQEMNAQE